jgi:GT2 family glycosyltransferase
MKMPPDTVTAVIPHWNRRELLQTLLENLTQQTRPFNEIIVVDNGSSDGSPELAQKFGARVIALDRNLGFAAAINRGVEASHSSWIAILNNDVTLAPDWLQILLASASAQSASFATGKILSATDPSLLDGAFDEVSRGACAVRCGSGKPDTAIWNQPRAIRFASMTAALFKKEVFQQLGGLDELFGSYMEDVDFGLRCAMAGYTGWYAPTAVAHHQGSATFGRWSADSVRRISRNQVLLAAKHFGAQPRLPIMIGQALWGLVALRHGCGIAFLRGKLAGRRDKHLLGRHEAAPETAAKLSAILQASEKEIFALGKQTGFDLYWRAYFWLSPR